MGGKVSEKGKVVRPALTPQEVKEIARVLAEHILNSDNVTETEIALHYKFAILAERLEFETRGRYSPYIMKFEKDIEAVREHCRNFLFYLKHLSE